MLSGLDNGHGSDELARPVFGLDGAAAKHTTSKGEKDTTKGWASVFRTGSENCNYRRDCILCEAASQAFFCYIDRGDEEGWRWWINEIAT